MADTLTTAQQDIEAYINVAKGWNLDQSQAYTFEALLQRGILCFDMVTKLDEDWRAAVLKEPTEYTKEMSDRLRNLYRIWSRPCPSVLERLTQFERAGFTVKCAEEFRSRCREAEGILTSDAEFFADDELVDLRDRAIDQHRQGQTVEFRSA